MAHTHLEHSGLIVYMTRSVHEKKEATAGPVPLPIPQKGIWLE